MNAVNGMPGYAIRIAQQGQETEKNESIGGIHGKT